MNESTLTSRGLLGRASVVPDGDEADPGCCAICGEFMSIPTGHDPTEICNECAQTEYISLRAQVAERDSEIDRANKFADDIEAGLSNTRDALSACEQQVAERDAEIGKLRQYRDGHMPDCAGQDLAAGYCGCGYLNGEYYREWLQRVDAAESALRTCEAERVAQVEEARKDIWHAAIQCAADECDRHAFESPAHRMCGERSIIAQRILKMLEWHPPKTRSQIAAQREPSP